jgi:hypothetical protein
MARPSATERLLSYVNVVDGCWLWIGAKQPNGYGSFYLDGRTLRAHRAAYEMFVGAIPGGLQIDHLCRRRDCVNPKHLEAVTHAENMRRIRRPECVSGHQLTDDNVYEHRGKRYCRSCRRDRVRASRSVAA